MVTGAVGAALSLLELSLSMNITHRGTMSTATKHSSLRGQRSSDTLKSAVPTDPLPPSTQRRARMKDICAESGLSASTVWRIRTRIAGFPAPDAYGRRDLSDCLAFIARMSAEDRRLARYGTPSSMAHAMSTVTNLIDRPSRRGKGVK